MSKDYYDILGVSKDASEEDIKVAFRKKAHQYHPDKKGGDEEKFKEVNEAYQVLGNKEKRKQYDQFGSTFQNGQAGGAGFGGFSGFEGVNMNMDDFGDMFGGFGDIFGFGGGRRSHRSSRGHDIEMILLLDFLEAAFGTEKEISFTKNIACSRCQGTGAEPGSKIETCPVCGGTGQVTRVQRTILGNIQTQSPCSHCGGEGKIYSTKCSKCRGNGIVREKVNMKVKIPAGINDGESIKLSGQGELNEKGGQSGDLYLRIKIKPYKNFVRSRYDIRTEKTISIKQAILGNKVDIETIHGVVKLKIPAGTQPDTIFRIRDKGVPKLHGRGIGDHYVKIKVEIPKRLNKKQKALLEELDI